MNKTVYSTGSGLFRGEVVLNNLSSAAPHEEEQEAEEEAVPHEEEQEARGILEEEGRLIDLRDAAETTAGPLRTEDEFSLGEKTHRRTLVAHAKGNNPAEQSQKEREQKERDAASAKNQAPGAGSSSTCGSGYIKTNGDTPGWGRVGGRGGGERVSTCPACGKLCDGQSACKSFECSPKDLRCNLNHGRSPYFKGNYWDGNRLGYVSDRAFRPVCQTPVSTIMSPCHVVRRIICGVQMPYVSHVRFAEQSCRIRGVSQSALRSPCHSVFNQDRNSGLVVVQSGPMLVRRRSVDV